MRIMAITLSLFASTFAVAEDGKPAAGKQVEQTLGTAEEPVVRYQLYLPKDYDKSDKKWPLIYFLHGRGESYGPLSLVKKWGPPRWADAGQDLPFVIVSPQCPKNDFWNSPAQEKVLLQLLDDVTKRHKIDTTRIYLTGLSMGGYGSWTLAGKHPKRFAAVAPICGGGDPKHAENLKTLPIWVWHGDKDRAVPLSRSVQMVDAIKKAGGTNIRFTTLEDIGHNSWSAAYATPELYSWFLKHKTK